MQPITELLSARDVEIIGQALRAAVEGTFFPDWEFHTLFGFWREEVRTVAEAWPTQTVDDEDFFGAAHQALLHLWGYPHGDDDQLKRYVSINDSKELYRVMERLDAIFDDRCA